MKNDRTVGVRNNAIVAPSEPLHSGERNVIIAEKPFGFLLDKRDTASDLQLIQQ